MTSAFLSGLSRVASPNRTCCSVARRGGDGAWVGVGARCNRLVPLPCQLSPNGDAFGVLDPGGARVKMGGKQGDKVASGVSRHG